MTTEIAPYINFDGQANAAIELYQSALGAEVRERMRWADMPGQEVPDAMKDRVMHACIAVGEQALYVSDVPPDRSLTDGDRAHVMVQLDPERIDQVFAQLAEGGQVTMPLENTFWKARFGALIDRFGVKWMLNAQLPE